MRHRTIRSELNCDQLVGLREQLLSDIKVCAREGTELALDLAAVTDWDGAGFQLLLSTGRSLRETGSRLRLQGASAELVAALARFGIDDCLGGAGGIVA